MNMIEKEKVRPHLLPRTAITKMPSDMAHALPKAHLAILMTLRNGLEARYVVAEPAHADPGKDVVQVVVDNVRDPALLIVRVKEGVTCLEANELADEEGRRG